MKLITLISDWHNDDFYTASVKGLLYSKCADIKVIDISNKIESYKYTQAAFVLRNAFLHFPVDTIHIVAINSDSDEQHPPICLKIKGHYFLGSASGIFSLMFSETPDVLVKINETDSIKNSTFPELTLYAEAASFLINGGDIKDLGPDLPHQYRHVQFMPAIDESIITGSVIYFDSYQNVFTNITRDLFNQVGKNRKFVITIKSDTYSMHKISKNYNEVEVGEMVSIFNSLDLLEISQRNGKLAKLLDIRLNSPVTVKFK